CLLGYRFGRRLGCLFGGGFGRRLLGRCLLCYRFLGCRLFGRGFGRASGFLRRRLLRSGLLRCCLARLLGCGLAGAALLYPTACLCCSLAGLGLGARRLCLLLEFSVGRRGGGGALGLLCYFGCHFGFCHG